MKYALLFETEEEMNDVFLYCKFMDKKTVKTCVEVNEANPSILEFEEKEVRV